jgi:hypothetical protein
MKLIAEIKTWLINRKRRKIIKLIVGAHITNQHTLSRAKELENAIYKTTKIVAKSVAEAELKREERFDEELLTSLQQVIKKHYSEKDKEYAKKDLLVNSLQETIRRKSDIIERVRAEA